MFRMSTTIREMLTDDAKAAAASVSQASEADVILFNARVTRGNQERLRDALVAREVRLPNVLLILSTEGGDPHAAYKIARLFQQQYTRFTCLIPAYSKSAATIVLMGAHDLAMTDDGEFGPVDVQLSKKDTLAEYESGLTVLTALNSLHEKAYLAWEHFFLAMEEKSQGSITLKTAAGVAAELTTGLFSPVYQQIDPLQLGEAARAMLIGNEYGKRLNRVSRNLRPNALDRLVAEYPDHGFVIDRTEAESLFFRVRVATSAELVLSNELGTFCDVESGRKNTFIDFLNEETEPATPAQPSNTEGATDVAIGSEVVQPADGTETPAQATGTGVPSNGQKQTVRRP
jgi:hypothetical protein